MLEWVASSFGRGSPRPRDQTQVSCNARGFFTRRATRKAHIKAQGMGFRGSSRYLSSDLQRGVGCGVCPGDSGI